MKTYALVLAAGKGTRMNSDIAKCAYPILDKPIIEYVVERFENSEYVNKTLVVVGYKKETFYDLLKNRVLFFEQVEQKGTANAVISAKEYLVNKTGQTIIVPGDVPLMTSKLTDKIIKAHLESDNDLTLCTMIVNNPTGYGRIIRDANNSLQEIIEEKDCTVKQKEIKEVNTGIYVVDNKLLFKYLDQVKPNEENGEYYLTDIVSLFVTKEKAGTFLIEDYYQTLGINNLVQVNEVETYLRQVINKKHMLNGVNIIDPLTTYISFNSLIEEGVTIKPNTRIEGKTIIKKGSLIGPDTTLLNVTIENDVVVENSIIRNSSINKKSYVGPFAHLRDDTKIGINTRIGNFVEIKNSTLGDDIFVSHHAYIGDAKVGDRVNFGCGSITVNFDGIDKYETIIGDDAFIGCNVNLIAPIEIEKETIIAAGSTVTKDVLKGSLVIARERETVKEGYYYKLMKKEKSDK